jgi:hypothetical protein
VGGSDRNYNKGVGKKIISSVFKVPGQFPIVFLAKVKHMIGINSKFNFL